MPLTARDPVERSSLFDELRAVYDACAESGRGRIVLLGGPVGTGKTEVLRMFVDSVRNRGGVVLAASASESERTLPLGVLEQLLDRPGMPADVVARGAALTDGQQPPWRTYLSRQSDPGGTVVDDLCDSLLQLATPLPLVVAVDDAHQADQPSLRCLHRLAQRLPGAAVLIVLVESTTAAGTGPVAAASSPEAAQHAGGAGIPAGAVALGGPWPAEVDVSRFEIAPLTVDGVAELLRRREGARAVGAAGFHHAVTGGNLVLLHAVLEDRRAVGAGTDDMVIGDNFAEAVTSCLFRCDPTTLQVARATAVLREPARPAVLARLLELDEAVVQRALLLLTGGGLLDGAGRFRHPIGRSAALGSMAQWERTELSQRVGHLHAGGGTAETVEVAEQLVEAGRRSGDWMPPVLREAAERSLADGDLDRARSLLRAAASLKMDERQRAEIAATQANLRWRTNPGEVLQHVPELLADIRAGRLTGRAAVTTLLYLLWHGQLDEALDILPQVVAVSADIPSAQRLLKPTLTALAFMYPGGARRLADQAGAVTDLLAAAGSVLRDCAPDGDTFGLTFAALYTSSFTADGWQDPWEPQVPASDLPVWQALTEAVAAERALRRGDLAAATDHARRGLSELGVDGWGVAVGWPISVLVCAASEAGDHTAAAGFLSMPVPAGMFSTPFGLRYLMARGRHHFATDRVHAALNDFYAGSETAAAWHLDLPELMPWRTELARAYVKLDRVGPSQDLIRQQLEGLTEGQTRLRGAALRVLAATLDPQARVPALKHAVDLLQAAGDQLEKARALADLGAAYQRTGRVELARTTLRAAEQQARLCGALPDTPKGRPLPAEPAAEADHPDAAQLTDAERRVAALAVKGYTNREIAQRLFLTVSTVEQHLTRVYRKLHVVRRRELPAWLRVGVFDDPD